MPDYDATMTFTLLEEPDKDLTATLDEFYKQHHLDVDSSGLSTPGMRMLKYHNSEYAAVAYLKNRTGEVVAACNCFIVNNGEVFGKHLNIMYPIATNNKAVLQLLYEIGKSERFTACESVLTIFGTKHKFARDIINVSGKPLMETMKRKL